MFTLVLVLKLFNNGHLFSHHILSFQSAERWRSLEMDAGIHNFELHAFRAAFQLVQTQGLVSL